MTETFICLVWPTKLQLFLTYQKEKKNEAQPTNGSNTKHQTSHHSQMKVSKALKFSTGLHIQNTSVLHQCININDKAVNPK